jgi:hypothetical protein
MTCSFILFLVIPRLSPGFRGSLVYVDWSIPESISGAHPAMLNGEHMRFFEAQEKVWVENEWRSGEMLFARMVVSDESLDLLQRIDDMIERKKKCRTSP